MYDWLLVVAVVYVVIAQTLQLVTAWRQRSGGATHQAASLRGEPPIPPGDAPLVRATTILRSIGCQVAYRPEFHWYEVDHLEYMIPAVEGIHRPSELVHRHRSIGELPTPICSPVERWSCTSKDRRGSADGRDLAPAPARVGAGGRLSGPR